MSRFKTTPFMQKRVVLLRFCALWAIVLLLLLMVAAQAQETAYENTVSVTHLETRLQEIEANTALDEGVRTQIKELFNRAKGHLESARTHARATAMYLNALETAPQEIEALRQQQERSPATTAPTPEQTQALQTLAISELEQRLSLEQTELNAAKSRLAEQERILREAQPRTSTARQGIADARQALQEIQSELRATPLPGETAELSEARRLLLLARQYHRETEIGRLEQEIASLPLRIQLSTLRRDQANREVQQAEWRVQWVQETLNELRRTQAAVALHQVASAERALADRPAVIRQLAERNAALGSELAILTHELEAATRQREAVEREVQILEKDFHNTQQKLAIAGLSVTLGRVLLEQRDALPDIRQYRAAAAQRVRLIADMGLADLLAADERRKMGAISATVERLMDTELAPLPEAQTIAQIREELTTLLHTQHDLLERLAHTRSMYLRALSELDFAERLLIERATEYADFLAEHLLWVPSHAILIPHMAWDVAEAAAWLLSPRNWSVALDHLGLEIWARPHLSLLALLVAIPLLWLRTRMMAHLEKVGAKVGRVHLDRFSHTLFALLLTLLLTLPGPWLLGFAGWLMYSAPEADDFTRAAGLGFLWAAPIWFNLALFLRMCNARGVATRHFLWNSHALGILRRQLKQLTLIAVPAVFVATTLSAYAPELYAAGLGRIAFIITLLAFALFMEHMLRPRGGAVAPTYAKRQGWLVRLRYLWYLLGVGIPLALAVLAWLGYYYSAQALSLRMVNTFWLVVAGIFLHDLTLRWLTLTRRRVAFQQALERREAARAARAKQGQSDSGSPHEEAEAPPSETPAIDLDLVDEKTRRLLRAFLYLLAFGGLWMIWSDVLPALSFLDAVHLWGHEVKVGNETLVKPITLADLLLALVFAIGALVLGRNLPALLEIILLQRTALQSGSRYAVTHLMQYGIALLGLGLVFSTLGFTWSKIQWLAAGLTVGLGFGLQEIFGNFISGLIILFERPVRVGDTVTVGNLTGRVSRIQIRATTITDWDRKEIIVPNKELITQRVINWTLSDAITRITLSVRIAYGSDTKLAYQTILEAVRTNPLVRNDPEPRVYFSGFGDSALNFDVYVFASELADRMPLMHELHMNIEAALRQHGLEIPFPQRDIHVSFASPNTPKDNVPHP